jgi:hypothetical protein
MQDLLCTSSNESSSSRFSVLLLQIYEVNTHKVTLSGSVRDANIVKYGVKKKKKSTAFVLVSNPFFQRV